MFKPRNLAIMAALAALATLPLTLAACTDSSPKPTPSITQTVSVAQERATIATVTQDFFNHFLGLTDDERKALVESVPKSAFDIKADGTLKTSTADAEKYNATLRAKDPELAVIDTRDYDQQQTLLLYASFIALSSYQSNANVSVDATLIKVNGATATLPASAITYLVDGKEQPQNTDTAASGTLHKVNGKWLISPSVSQ